MLYYNTNLAVRISARHVLTFNYQALVNGEPILAEIWSRLFTLKSHDRIVLIDSFLPHQLGIREVDTSYFSFFNHFQINFYRVQRLIMIYCLHRTAVRPRRQSENNTTHLSK